MQIANLSDFTAVLNKPTTTPPEPPQSTVRPKLARGGDYAERKARAARYAAKAEHRAEGEGRNQKAYNLSAAIREKFDLSEDDRLEILRGWNVKNTPPHWLMMSWPMPAGILIGTQNVLPGLDMNRQSIKTKDVQWSRRITKRASGYFGDGILQTYRLKRQSTLSPKSCRREKSPH